jgi:methionyl aminopeptidase
MTDIQVKSEREIKIMAEGGRILDEVRQKTAELVRPGITTGEVDAFADQLITRAGGQASFKMVPGYKHATCININEVVVHGIPGKEKVKSGDIVGIDVGVFYKGFHTDGAVTLRVEESKSRRVEEDRFLETGRAALRKAIEQLRPGKRVWDISAAMQTVVEKAGYSAVRSLTGHGVGRELHEEPAIPCFVTGKREHTPRLEAGMVLAVEVMMNQGTWEVVYKNQDGWTIVTADGKISALFEETVAVTKKGPVVLTENKR